MKLKYISFLLFLIPAFLMSCTQEVIYQDQIENSVNTSYLGNNEYVIDLKVDDANMRTRVVDFSENSSIRLNQVWLGAFDYETGELVSSQTKTMDYRTILTGVIQEGMIRISLDDPKAGSSGQYVMTCLANYIGVTDSNGNDLEERLSQVTTWDDFNSIAVDVNTAYSNMHNGIVPVLAGFLYDNSNDDDNDETHIKIDQFKQGDNATKTGVLLSPSHKINHVIIKTDNSGKFNFTGMLLKLRRLVANINVNINVTNNNLLLTDVSYKRFNMPKAVYIIERRTTNCTNITSTGTYTPGEFAPSDKPQESPNWADLDPKNSYFNDSEWIYGNTTGFSFQHFANKHWARNILEKQSDREECSKYGEDVEGNNLYYYHALVDNNKQNPETYADNQDFNNYASYFVIKMHLIDRTTGKALEAEYTIHEGNTSDELGNPVDKYETYRDPNTGVMDLSRIQGNMMDYVVARNIDYTYNVFIEGVNHIYHNVNIGINSNEDMEHHNGQGGKVWQFYYANDYYDVDGNRPGDDGRGESIENNCQYNDVNGSFINTIPHDGGYYRNAIRIIRRDPDLSFRLYGCVKAGQPIAGYNYNFPQESFSYLDKLWPPSAGLYSHYFLDYKELQSNGSEIPKELLDGLKIIDPKNTRNEEMDLVRFIQYIYEEKYSSGDDLPWYFDIKVNKSDIEGPIDSRLKNDYVRALYITDRLGVPDDVDGCTRSVNIFAAVQYPELEIIEEKIKLEKPDMDPLNINYNYNIIEPYVRNISVPILRKIIDNQSEYAYQLLINGTGMGAQNATDFSKYGQLDSRGEYWVYTIPMNEFPWSTADVYLKVISKVTNKYDDSEVEKIGTITLNNHAAWYNTESEWKSLIDNYTTANAGENKGTYLRFYSTDSGKTFKRDIENNIYYISTGGGACTIEFSVYKACKITVKARTSSSATARGVSVTSESDGTKSSDLNTGTDWKTYTFNISANTKASDGKNLIKINPNGGGVHFQSIEVSPL